jgi:hypothetical protein
MQLRNWFLRVLPIFTLIGLIGGASAVITAVPTSTAQACNPCNCPEDRRINCEGIQFYGIYTFTRGSTCYIDAYRMQSNGSPGRRAWRYTSTQLENLPATPDENTLLTQGDAIALYQLTSGELQVNAGPIDGKVYTIIWQGCPAGERRELSWEVSAPGS